MWWIYSWIFLIMVETCISEQKVLLSSPGVVRTGEGQHADFLWKIHKDFIQYTSSAYYYYGTEEKLMCTPTLNECNFGTWITGNIAKEIPLDTLTGEFGVRLFRATDDLTHSDISLRLYINSSSMYSDHNHDARLFIFRPVGQPVIHRLASDDISLYCNSTSRSVPAEHRTQLQYTWYREQLNLTGGDTLTLSDTTCQSLMIDTVTCTAREQGAPDAYSRSADASLREILGCTDITSNLTTVTTVVTSEPSLSSVCGPTTEGAAVSSDSRTDLENTLSSPDARHKQYMLYGAYAVGGVALLVVIFIVIYLPLRGSRERHAARDETSQIRCSAGREGTNQSPKQAQSKTEWPSKRFSVKQGQGNWSDHARQGTNPQSPTTGCDHPSGEYTEIDVYASIRDSDIYSTRKSILTLEERENKNIRDMKRHNMKFKVQPDIKSSVLSMKKKKQKISSGAKTRSFIRDKPVPSKGNTQSGRDLKTDNVKFNKDISIEMGDTIQSHQHNQDSSKSADGFLKNNVSPLEGDYMTTEGATITEGEYLTTEGATMTERAIMSESTTMTGSTAIIDGATLAEGTTITEGTTMTEGSAMTENATITEGATIAGGTTLAEGATMTEGARIRPSMIESEYLITDQPETSICSLIYAKTHKDPKHY